MTEKRYHVSPDGNPRACSAKVKCKYGEGTPHYKDVDSARKGYEEAMEKKFAATAALSLGSPILVEPNKMKPPGLDFDSADYSVETDYDGYGCADPDCGSDGDMCRDRSYYGLRVTDWDGAENYAKYKLNIPLKDKLDPALENALEPFQDFEAIKDDFEVWGEDGYYGEEVRATAPEDLTAALKDYYYSQPNSTGPDNILSYLREKGFDTTGHRPLDAIKLALAQENGGKISKEVNAARSWRMSSISLKNIVRGSKSQTEVAAKDPRPLATDKKLGAGKEIAGVVIEQAPGVYRLVDGYHRTAFLDNTSRRKATYIILSKQPNNQPSFYSRHNASRFGWNQE